MRHLGVVCSLIMMIVFFTEGAPVHAVTPTPPDVKHVVNNNISKIDGQISSTQKNKIRVYVNPYSSSDTSCPGWRFKDGEPYSETVNRAGAYFQAGFYAAVSGQHNMAAWCFLQAAKINSQCPVFLSNAAFALNALGQYKDALVLLDWAVVLEPSSASAWVNAGYANMKLKNYAAAKDAYTNAIIIEPDIKDYQRYLMAAIQEDPQMPDSVLDADGGLPKGLEKKNEHPVVERKTDALGKLNDGLDVLSEQESSSPPARLSLGEGKPFWDRPKKGGNVKDRGPARGQANPLGGTNQGIAFMKQMTGNCWRGIGAFRDAAATIESSDKGTPAMRAYGAKCYRLMAGGFESKCRDMTALLNKAVGHNVDPEELMRETSKDGFQADRDHQKELEKWRQREAERLKPPEKQWWQNIDYGWDHGSIKADFSEVEIGGRLPGPLPLLINASWDMDKPASDRWWKDFIPTVKVGLPLVEVGRGKIGGAIEAYGKIDLGSGNVGAEVKVQVEAADFKAGYTFVDKPDLFTIQNGLIANTKDFI
jgi:tetratricopeptide (TPR) repeat protein